MSGHVRRGGRPLQGEPVLDRGLRLLAAFRQPGEALTLTALSERAGLAKSTASRLLDRLVDWGALERRTDGRYLVGTRIVELASLAPPAAQLRAHALPHLLDLYRDRGQHVVLAAPQGNDAFVVETLSGPPAAPLRFHVGERLPLRSTAGGLVLLAHAAHTQRERLVRQMAITRADLGVLQATLAAARRSGLALVQQRTTAPWVSVAAPILGRSGSAIGSVAAVMPGRITERRMRRVADTAQAISAQAENAVNVGDAPTES